jgi:hypothetical protein
VRGQACEQGARLFTAKNPARQHRGWLDRAQAESRGCEKMPRDPERTEQFCKKEIGLRRERLHERAVGSRVGAERSASLFDRSLEHRDGAIVEWMSQGCAWVNQLEAMLSEWKRLEERRGDRERMNG